MDTVEYRKLKYEGIAAERYIYQVHKNTGVYYTYDRQEAKWYGPADSQWSSYCDASTEIMDELEAKLICL